MNTHTTCRVGRVMEKMNFDIFVSFFILISLQYTPKARVMYIFEIYCLFLINSVWVLGFDYITGCFSRQPLARPLTTLL